MTEGLRAEIVAEARAWIGTPYLHQGCHKRVGCDCLGLVRGVWTAIYGTEPESPPAYSADWAEGTRQETLIEAARRHMIEIDPRYRRPGDLLVFRWRPRLPAKHVAILVAPERIVHAYDTAGKVAEGNLHRQWAARIAAAFAFPERPC